MQLICISRGTFAGGKQLAESLAAKLGYDCISREELADAATDAGIAVGKVEMAVVRRRPLNEWLHIEKERFKAFIAASLCERALKGGLVYHGRCAHVHLTGIAHTMRVRAVMDADMRTALTMQRLGITREKAKRYNEDVDLDRGRWVKTLYNVDWQDPATYDMVVNLSHVTAGNASAALTSMAQLPEFQPTPASLRALSDILVASRARLAIADDARTRLADVQVRAQGGRVLVTYLPRQQQLSPLFPAVLGKVPGVEEIVCTMAGTSLLWVQERFDAKSEGLEHILDVASRWGAAVEVVRLSPAGAAAGEGVEDAEAMLLGAAAQATDKAGHGGVLDDGASVDVSYGDEGLDQVMARLISAGRAGGHRQVSGGPKELVAQLDRSASYSLVVVGDVYLSKPEAARKRLARDLVGFLADKLKVPVVGVEELGERFFFGAKQWAKMILLSVLAAVLIGAVLTHQKEVLTFLLQEGTGHRVLATASLVVVAPLFAYLYGGFSRYLLRLFRFE